MKEASGHGSLQHHRSRKGSAVMVKKTKFAVIVDFAILSFPVLTGGCIIRRNEFGVCLPMLISLFTENSERYL